MLVNFMHNHNFLLSPIIFGNNVVDRVPICKLLGVYISNYHIDYTFKKASKPLFSLLVLKKAGVPYSRLILKVYLTTIRPVILEYRKIPKISPWAYIFQKRPFLRGLFLEGLMYGEKFAFKNRLGQPFSWQEIYRFSSLYFVFEGNFPSTSPRGAYIWSGRQQQQQQQQRQQLRSVLAHLLPPVKLTVCKCQKQQYICIALLSSLNISSLYFIPACNSVLLTVKVINKQFTIILI